jgi:hypothetical protein
METLTFTLWSHRQHHITISHLVYYYLVRSWVKMQCAGFATVNDDDDTLSEDSPRSQRKAEEQGQQYYR